MKRRNSALAAATAAFAFVACSSQMRSAGSEFQFATDAAAIKATLDTTTAGWNRGELPVYLSAYADSAEVGDPIELVGSQQFGFASRLRAGIRPVGE